MAASGKKYLLKILILGESAVGKTSLLERWVNNRFSLQTKSTIGADFLSKQIVLDGRNVTLQIWDTAGQERFQGLGANFYRGTDGVMFCYDCTRKQTFECLEQWRNAFLIQSNHDENVKFPMVLICNKIDLENRQVPTAQGEEWARKFNMPYFETSAKDSLNVDSAFTEIAKIVIGEMPESEVIYGETVKLEPAAAPEEKCGC